MNLDKMFPYHGHDNKSVSDGVPSTAKIVQEHLEKGYNRVLLTNHGTCASNIDLIKCCNEHNINPTIGIEFYYIPEINRNKIQNESSDFVISRDDSKTFHLTVLVASEKGQENLNKLIYLSNLKKDDEITVDGLSGCHYSKPRITEAQLFHFSEGLIVSSGCRLSVFNQLILSGQTDKASEMLLLFKANLENFFIELHVARNEIEEQLFHWLLEFALKHDIPVIPANDFHYLKKGDLRNWNLLSASRNKNTLSSYKGISNDDFYIKTKFEMLERLKELSPRNVERILEGFSLMDSLITYKPKLEKVAKLHIENAEKILYKRLTQGLIRMFGSVEKIPEDYKARTRKEFETAKITDNCSYYIFVADLIKWCLDRGMMTPIGRGSAGSLLSFYLLGITKVDPMLYGLLAERASNPQRLTMLDADLDFSKEDVEIIKNEYLYKKYGKDCVANIANYGEYKMSSSIKSSMRFLEVPVYAQNQINKLIKQSFVNQSHEDSDDTLEPTLSNVSKLSNFTSIFTENNVYNYNEILEYASGIEGAYSNTSVHASGILISNRPIYMDYPTVRVGQTICSAYDMNSLKYIDALKLDLLSVNTYSNVAQTLAM